MKLKFALNAVMLLLTFSAIATAQNCRCESCENPYGQQTLEQRRFWKDVRDNIASSQGPTNAGPSNFGFAQMVFLDFDSGDDGDVDYTRSIRDAIQAEMENIYQGFNVVFSQTNPGGLFSTIVFNSGGAGGGIAEDIDFRNVNPSDNAVLNASGIGLTSDEDITAVSSLIAAHELGHLLGLRHHDMFGPIGNGVPPGFGPFYTPVYTGPTDSFEQEDHVMITGAFGIPFAAFFGPNWFSERSSVKLTIATGFQTTADAANNDSIATAQAVELTNMTAPNTIVDGQNTSDFDFSASALVVEGSLDGTADPRDVFQIEARAGDLFNMAVLSTVPDRLAINPIDPNISVFDSTGAFVDYFGSDAFNENELKSLDSIVTDLVIPADGTYFIQVDSPDVNDSGVYELLVYRFNGLQGDVNCDGNVDLLDVAPFVDAITSGDSLPKADMNNDGFVNLLDVQPFVALLNNG